jgi:hypothetical protein
MIGHLGPRVSALLDGQLSAAEAEKAWAHVHACHFCRDLVEREGWVKTQLAGLSYGGGTTTPDSLKGALTHGLFSSTPALVRSAGPSGARSRTSVVFLGGTALGAAVAGVLALGVAQSGAPADRRPPITSLTRPSASTSASPVSASPSATEPADSSTGLRLPTRRGAGGIAGVKIDP